MTRKRYIKLKMAEGLSRNEATQNAREIVEEGASYQEDYDHDATLPKLTPEQVEALVSGIKEAVPNIVQAVGVFAEAVGKSLINIGEAVSKAGQKTKKEVLSNETTIQQYVQR